MKNRSIGVVIPARNEEQQLPEVLKTGCAVEWLNQVVVVDDHSTDRTPEIARDFSQQDDRFSIARPDYSNGKSLALFTGVLALSDKIDDVLFLDADLIGLQCSHIKAVYSPLGNNKCNMAVAVFRGGEVKTTASQVVTPYLSGQRGLKRMAALHVLTILQNSGYGAEIGFTMMAHWEKWKIQYVPWKGVTHLVKENKHGLRQGIKARAGMYSEILTTMIELQKEKNRLHLPEEYYQDPDAKN